MIDKKVIRKHPNGALAGSIGCLHTILKDWRLFNRLQVTIAELEHKLDLEKIKHG